MIHTKLIKRNIYILSAGLLIACLMPGNVFAQGKSEEVTIIAPYNPTVTTAQKINRNPRLVIPESEALPEIAYGINSVRAETRISPENPRPANIPKEPSKDLYRSHMRAGFGNYLTPYFELWVNSLQSDAFDAGAHVRHLSSFGDIKDYAKSSFSNSLVEAYGNKYFNDNTLGGKVYYTNRMVNRYGFMPAAYPQYIYEDKDIQQVFQKAGIDFRLGSNKTERDAFNYDIAFKTYYLFDKYESNETGINAIAGISKGLDLFDNRRSQKLGLELEMDYYLNKDSLTDYHGGIFAATPFIDLDLKPYRIYVGLKFNYKSDTTSKLSFYPIVRAEAGLLEEMLVIYAAVEGGTKRISYDLLTLENPFVNAILPLDYQKMYDFSGGIKGRISELVDFNAGLRYQIVENIPLFVNDTTRIPQNTFSLVYDDAGIFSVYGELGFRSRSDFGLVFRTVYNAYTMDTEEKAWHRPGLELSLNTYYIIKEKITLNAYLSSLQGVYARTYENNAVVAEQIDGWFDLSLGGEYQITEQFSAFLKLNNLLNNGYSKWYQYPVHKFNVLAGVGFSF